MPGQCQANTYNTKIGLSMEQPMIHWSATDKYHECNFELEVKKIFMTNNYNIQESEKVPRILNWLCWEGFRFIQALNDERQENTK